MRPTLRPAMALEGPTVYGQVMYSKTWSRYGSHTIRLVAVGTADRPLVTVDAFEVVK